MFDHPEDFGLAESGAILEAATQLAPVAPLKAKPGMRSWPAYFTTTKPSDSAIARPERGLINKDVTTYRSGSTTHKVLQDMCDSSPELSNAVYTAIRLGVPERYVAIARDMDGTINEDATRTLQSLIARFDVVGDPAEGYVGSGSIKSCSESLARDIVMYGQEAAELVLDKSRMPYRIQPISSTVIQFKPDGNGVKPFQKVGSDELDLDVPTVVIIQLDSNLITPYATSPLEPALRAVIFSETFMNDLLRVMRRAIHPRLRVSIDEERFRKNLSPEAQMDADVARQEMAALVSEIENKVNGLAPEDALIFFDTLGFDVETPAGAGDSYDTLRDIANAKMASGSKTLPSVLGLAAGSASSNIASTEVAVYLRSIDSSIRQKLNEMYSRLFTIAIRLMGADCYATFEYEALSIRPDAEMESFSQTRQMRILELLELGLITDFEACLKLTGKLPPPGYKPLAGTMFRSQKASAEPATDTSTNGGSTLNQNLKPDTPDTARGQNKKKKAVAQPQNLTVQIDNTKQESAAIIRMKRDENGDLIVTKEATA